MFGWSVDEVLEMPARRFFKILEAGRRWVAMERIEACRIAAVSGSSKEYAQELMDSLSREAKGPKAISAESASREARALSGTEAQATMMSAFR